ncbi:MAG: inositol monophosphatase family protein [Nocardioides sp.]
MSGLEADATLAAELVRDAGRLAGRMRAEGLDAEQKTSVSDIVTAADHAAERLVVERLARLRPADGLLGEEGHEHDGTSGRRWVVDPVDGTYNFHRGLTWWCSAVALVDGDELLLGAVYHPHEDALYVGGPGLPSTRDGVPLPRLVDVPLARACAATYLHHPVADGPTTEAFTRVAGRSATIRMLGSGTMDAMAVAQGQLDLTFQHSVPDWDRLPGAAVVLGAGGTARQVEAAGRTWSLVGAPTAVAQAAEALGDD